MVQVYGLLAGTSICMFSIWSGTWMFQELGILRVDLEPEDMRADFELEQAWTCNYRSQPVTCSLRS